GLEEIVKLRAPGLLGCVLSGAGPSILVFYERGYEQVCDLVCQVFALHGRAAEVLWTEIAPRGYELTGEG
ncbi:MAG: homoserine kinase, partial [Bryobacteraceae bacterium]